MSAPVHRPVRCHLAPGRALLSVAGVFLVTVVCTVPPITMLAKVYPAGLEGASLWDRYRARWTAWKPRADAGGGGAATPLTLAGVCS